MDLSKNCKIPKYYCVDCQKQYTTSSNYCKHLKTETHKRKGLQKCYYCALCDFGTVKKMDYDRHLASNSHIHNVNKEVIDVNDLTVSRSEFHKVLNTSRKLNKIQKAKEKKLDKIKEEFNSTFGGIQIGGLTKKQKNLNEKMELLHKEYVIAYDKYDEMNDLYWFYCEKIRKMIKPIYIRKLLQTWKYRIIKKMDNFAILNFK